MSEHAFELICEIEPPTRPDLRRVRHQIGVLTSITNTFLIPDNHIGRATVSSIAVANEVQAMGARGIACLNSRDRNSLGFHRDLLTAAAYGVTEFLFVHGDKPTVGDRTSELTVRSMMHDARSADIGAFPAGAPPRIGVTSRFSRLPSWKREADFVFTQMSYSLDDMLRWRDTIDLDVPIYAGVMVVASAQMARRLAGSIPDITIPESLIEAVERDRAAGVDFACEQIFALRDSGAFAGVHLVPVTRYRDVAARLEREL